jgi:hypothetical protein
LDGLTLHGRMEDDNAVYSRTILPDSVCQSKRSVAGIWCVLGLVSSPASIAISRGWGGCCRHSPKIYFLIREFPLPNRSSTSLDCANNHPPRASSPIAQRAHNHLNLHPGHAHSSHLRSCNCTTRPQRSSATFILIPSRDAVLRELQVATLDPKWLTRNLARLPRRLSRQLTRLLKPLLKLPRKMQLGLVPPPGRILVQVNSSNPRRTPASIYCDPS